MTLVPLELTPDHASFILSGYAAFEEPATIYKEFVIAYPELLEGHSRDQLEKKVEQCNPANPAFDVERYGAEFEALRRRYLSSQEDAYLSHSRNRLETLDRVRRDLLAYADLNPDKTVESLKAVVDLTREARFEATAFAKLQADSPRRVAPETLARLMSQLPAEKFQEVMKAYQRGDHPELIVEQIEYEVKALTDGKVSGPTLADQTQEVQQKIENAERSATEKLQANAAGDMAPQDSTGGTDRE